MGIPIQRPKIQDPTLHAMVSSPQKKNSRIANPNLEIFRILQALMYKIPEIPFVLLKVRFIPSEHLILPYEPDTNNLRVLSGDLLTSFGDGILMEGNQGGIWGKIRPKYPKNANWPSQNF